MSIKKILNLAFPYNLFQCLVGAERFRTVLVQEFIKPQPDKRILDIGCGTAEILQYLPALQYYGFDSSINYINQARARFGERGVFECGRVCDQILDKYEKFDVVLAIGVLHHLDDSESEHLFRLASHALNQEGRLITVDCCYTSGQSRLAHWITSRDQGEFIRQPEQYQALAQNSFPQVDMTVRAGLLNVPYAHTIMECRQA